MISFSKHYITAQNFRIVCVLSVLFVLCVNSSAQSQSIGRGIYNIFYDYGRTHWKSADNIEQILDHISSFPEWKRKDLKESIIYLQSKTDYVYYRDTINCHFESDVCTFILPQYVQPCEIMTDTSVDAFLRKIKIASVCFDKERHVVYSALSVSEHYVSKLQKEILKTESQYSMIDGIWIPLVIKKESKSVQNYCTQEYIDSNMQNLIIQHVRAIWRRYPNVAEIRFGLFFPQTKI